MPLADLPLTTFVQNAALLLAVAVVFDAAIGRFGAVDGRRGRVMIGALLGAIGVSIMLTPFQLAPGLFFDSRVAFLTTVGLFFGPVPGAIAAAAMSAFRIAQGGGGVASGLAVFSAALLLGLLWRRRKGRELEQQSLVDLWAFGFVTVLLMLPVIAGGLFLTLPAATATTAIRLISVPIVVVSPVAVALLGSLLVNRLRTSRLTEANVRLAAAVEAQLEEVRASRARIVEAGDAERKRLERDLHDGAQQRLVSLALALRLARTHLDPAGDRELAASLDQATDEAKAALAELRELARGIHPQVLTEAGLGAAVTSLAGRAPLPVDVEVHVPRLSPVIESTAYFVVSEALANVAKYANAGRAVVRARAQADRLVVEVVDDGTGGADPARGSGLRGLADRLAAIDGTLDVHSPTGQGTRVVARIPIPVAAPAQTVPAPTV